MAASKRRYLGFVAAVGALAAFSGPTHSAGLSDELAAVIKTHKRVIAADSDCIAANEQVKSSWGDWYPTFDATTNIGHEKQVKPTGSEDTDLVPRNVELSITQKVWDFGSTNASIRRAELALDQCQETRTSTLQTLLLEGVTAHVNVIRAQRLVDFAAGSVANIKKQAELEDARVQRGSGFSTDVLQAKTQLAGALARQIQTQGALRTALNRYRAVFGKLPENFKKMKDPRLPLDQLPKSLDEAVALSIKGNPQLAASRVSADIARQDVRKTRADEFFPVFEASAESNFEEDNADTVGSKQERLIKLEMTYDFNLGFTAVNTLKASRHTHIATINRYADTRDLIEEQARNAWDSLETARTNAEHLHNQANIASEFLELARRERQLGNRSLIDVLAGETALINASSDAASADTDVAVAVFTLLNVMGKLSPKIVE